MKLSFLPGELYLNQERDGTYLITVKGHEVLRTKVEKKALVKFNALRRGLESQFPARELTPEEKTAALVRSVMDYKLVEVRASTKPPKKDRKMPRCEVSRALEQSLVHDIR